MKRHLTPLLRNKRNLKPELGYIPQNYKKFFMKKSKIDKHKIFRYSALNLFALMLNMADIS